jgi:hypothetical protein
LRKFALGLVSGDYGGLQGVQAGWPSAFDAGVCPMTARIALVARGRVTWRALSLAALLALLLGATASQLLRAGESSSAPAAGSAAGLSSLGPAARASISAALGADDPAYHFNAAPGGFRGANPAQHMGLELGRTGVLLRSRSLRLGLSLRALGYGSSLQAVPGAQPSAAANRVSYAHGALSEWYVNGPLGLEQGFTLARAPARGATGPLTLAISLSGGAHASLAAGGASVTFSGPHGGELRYGALSVSDASGRTLHSWLALAGGQLLLRVEAAGARFPLRVDPVVEAAERRLSPTLAAEPEKEDAGLSVSLSADGNTALIGAPDAALSGGTAWVFARSGMTWTQQAKLEIPKASEEDEASMCGEEGAASEEGDECGFGRSVALSADGDTALVGAPRSRGGEGSAWVFTREGTQWSSAPTELISPEAGPDGHFGRSVALSFSGETALVGAPGELQGAGRAWVFTSSGTGWIAQPAPLTGTLGEGGGRFGRAVALSGNGEVALVGAPGNTGFVGSASAFARTDGGWIAQGPKLTGAGEVGEGHFGYSVALSEDGSTALVGARDDNGGTGAAWVFGWSGTEWSEQGPKLTGEGAAGEEFGYSVALSAAGNTAVIGAPRVAGGAGVAWVYARWSTGWSPALKQLVGGNTEESKARFGSAVATSADGEVDLVGGPDESAKGGAAWVFGQGPAVESVKPSKGSQLGGITVTISGKHLQRVTAVNFGATAAQSFSVLSEEEVTAVSPPGTGAVDITVETPFGTSADNSGDLFTYMPSGHGSGKGGSGEEPSGGSPAPGSNNNEDDSTIHLPEGSEQVLALGPVSSAVCGASLRSKKIAVQAHGHSSRALFKLLGTGTGKCSGKLRLRVKLKLAGKRFKLKTIGTAVFSISAGQRVSVLVKLNAAGRALLKARHGRLNASLLLVKSLPTPLLARTASVRLALQRPKPKHKT